jgi:small subunit ribosomal protein S21
MVTVVRRENESFEKLYKRFRKLVEQERIISELKMRSHYMKPSVKKRYKRQRALARLKKKMLKLQKSTKRSA